MKLNFAWPVDLVIGHIAPEFEPLLSCIETEVLQSGQSPNEQLLNADATVRSLMSHLVTEGKPLKVSHILNQQLEVWEAGFSYVESAGPSPVVGYLCVSATPDAAIGKPRVTRSGSIAIHDPRAGAGMIFAPGAPFGRPLTLEMRTGAFVLFPGWLRHAVLPVSPGEVRIMLRCALGVTV